ncbi:MAG TPA: hypothetical protein DCF44_08420 [Chitinophagaceae bacterium]|nr:hypothetical protein [Chitinophagaceae bacterium]
MISKKICRLTKLRQAPSWTSTYFYNILESYNVYLIVCGVDSNQKIHSYTLCKPINVGFSALNEVEVSYLIAATAYLSGTSNLKRCSRDSAIVQPVIDDAE